MTLEVLTFGCRLNTYESEAMRALIGAAPPPGATILVNTCAVTAEAESQARQAIRAAHRRNPLANILVTGCAAQIDPARWAALPGVTRIIGNADKLTPATWSGTWGSDAPPAPGSIAATPQPLAEHLGRTRALVQVQQGCDHRCTFCVIPYGRGPSRSVPVGAIVDQVRRLAADGCREVTLTGVDIASYGPDLPGRPSLGQMVRRLLALVPELPRLRLSSLDPAGLDADLWRLIAEEPRLMPYLHLSLQHGAGLILKRMKRRHSPADALAIARHAAALRPGIALGADLIAGFPTETADHLEATLAMVAEMQLRFLHVFPYSERPGTPAARMPQLPVALRRERAARLRQAGQTAAAAFYASRLGQEEDVLFERGNRGRTAHFAPLRLCRGDLPPGTLRRVRVTALAPDGLLAEAA